MAKAKQKTVYACTSCGTTAARWLGRCPGCGEWNTLAEETTVRRSGGGAAKRVAKAAALPPKLTVPMVMFFLPVIFMVLLGPSIILVMGFQ